MFHLSLCFRLVAKTLIYHFIYFFYFIIIKCGFLKEFSSVLLGVTELFCGKAHPTQKIFSRWNSYISISCLILQQFSYPFRLYHNQFKCHTIFFSDLKFSSLFFCLAFVASFFSLSVFLHCRDQIGTFCHSPESC